MMDRIEEKQHHIYDGQEIIGREVR